MFWTIYPGLKKQIMSKLILVFIVSALLSALSCFALIKVFKRLKVGQTILHYVSEHSHKNGTPTMGGLSFILSAIAVFFVFCKAYPIATAAAVIFLAYSLVGFIDDLLKVRFSKNQGLTALQKIIFQLGVSLIVAVFCVYMGITNVYIPFTGRLVNLGLWSVPLNVLVFIATTNCVNLTDGLDGLCSTTSMIFMLGAAALIGAQLNKLSDYYIVKEEYSALIALAISCAGSLLGFLLFNTNKAQIFMGDTGSLGLGAVISSIMIFSGNTLYIPIMGIIYVISGLSVIIQVLVYKRTKKRVFKMAPFHHHLQQNGHSEAKIAFIYAFITVICSLSCVLVYAN